MLLLVFMRNLGIVFIDGFRGIIRVIRRVGTMRMRMLLVWCFMGYADLDMRKPLKRDKLRQSIRENGENFLVSPEDVVF